MNDVIGFLEHEFGPAKPRMRVHRPGWLPDQFEIMDYDDFQTFKRLAERVGFCFVDLEQYPDYEAK
jgi:hypothetical protein